MIFENLKKKYEKEPNTNISNFKKEIISNRSSFQTNLRKFYNSNNNQAGIHNNIIMSSIVSIKDAIASVQISSDFKSFIKENSMVWVSFGTTDSHILRTKLMGLMTKAGLTQLERFAVYFFCARVKDKDRILQGMELLPEEAKSKDWFKNVKKFYNQYTVKWPKLETASNFATLHLPNTNPGFDLLSTAMMFDVEGDEKILDLIMNKLTTGQLKLSSEMQAIHEGYAKIFWNDKVKGSKNPLANETAAERKKGFIKEYYDTSAADTYPLVKLTMGGTPEEVSVSQTGYTREELISWYKTVRESMK